jgi:hypothetical protein
LQQQIGALCLNRFLLQQKKFKHRHSETDDQIWVKVLGFRFYQPIFSFFLPPSSLLPTHPPTYILLLHDFIASWFLPSRMTGFRQQFFLFVNLQLHSFAGAQSELTVTTAPWGMDGWMDGW